jgi:hypothetical protein
MDTTNNKLVGVAKVVGKGRVFAWSDDWVTYTSQWGSSTPPAGTTNYDDATKYPECVGHTAASLYKVPQFWYNVFRWVVAPNLSCFTLNDPTIVLAH